MDHRHIPFSAFDTSPYGVRMSGPDMLNDNAAVLSKLINNDHGLEEHKKQSLLAMINSPDIFNRLVAGGLGVAVVRSAKAFDNMSKPAQLLVSMAGFGVGRALYDTLHNPEKFSTYNNETAVTKIKL